MYRNWRPLDPGEATSVEDRYAALPVLGKSDIRAYFPYGIVPQGLDLDEALARNEISFVKTSGTADESLTNIWNQSWWNDSERASWSLNSHAAKICTGSHREAILASALSVGPRSESAPIKREARILRNYLFLNEYGSPAEWPEGHELRIIKELDDYSPPVLEANPSLLARISRWAFREGKNVFQPGLITLTYEFISALQLRDIQRVFSSPIASSYGSTEAGYVFMECEHRRLHQNSDFCRVDLVPISGLEDQKIGRILVTTFGNRWFPLLRFEIGDLGRVAPDPCPCGRNFGMTLLSIEGRLISLFLGAGNRPVTHRQLDQAIASVAGIEEYRLDQELPERVRLRIVAEGSRSVEVVRNDAKDALQSLLGDEIEIGVETVQTLAMESSGKFLLAKRHFPLDSWGSAKGKTG
jgi:phenylacetate-CoA ligase